MAETQESVPAPEGAEKPPKKVRTFTITLTELDHGWARGWLPIHTLAHTCRLCGRMTAYDGYEGILLLSVGPTQQNPTAEFLCIHCGAESTKTIPKAV